MHVFTNGIQEVTNFFRLIYENKDFAKFEPREFVAEVNMIVCLGYWEEKFKKTGQAYSGDYTLHIIFEMEEYMNTEIIMISIVWQWI